MAKDQPKQRVGYKNPPIASRYPPGTSGNPNGRPRKIRKGEGDVATPLFFDRLRDELATIIEVGEGGRRIAMSKLAVVIRAQFNAAAKGNASAQRALLESACRIEVYDAARSEAEREERREACDAMARYKAKRARVWQEADAKGSEPAEPWPHPEDILPDPSGEGWRVRGPVYAQCMPRYLYYRAMRDSLFVQSVLDRRSRKPGSVALALWLEFDRLLPKRWQIEFRFEELANALFRIPIGELRYCVALVERRMLEAERDASIPAVTAQEVQRVRQMWAKLQSAKTRRALARQLEAHGLISSNPQSRKKA